MNIAIVHFHLNTGGVTTVIRQQTGILAGHCDVVVITGEPPEDRWPVEVVVIPSLAYDNRRRDTDGPDAIARSIDSALRNRFSSGVDVVHVHNPTLCKNRHLLPAIHRLRDMGHALFLQIHDFAEDGRLHVYDPSPYPDDCHYGAINARDWALLGDAGLVGHGCHFLPNTVSPMAPAAFVEGNAAHVLYPVRAIRRKNIGEAILLSAFFPDDLPLCITRPPNSPADVESYRQWKRLSSALHAGVCFEAGLRARFSDLVAQSRAMVTTSISEGFGFAFLEPWTAEKPLMGRKLPGIVDDMEQRGVDLTHMYTALNVPMSWVDRRALSKRWTAVLDNVASVTGFADAPRHIGAELERRLEHDTIDFGLLHESLQAPVVARAVTDRSAAQVLRDLNPFLSEMVDACGAERIQCNRTRVLTGYTPDAYREALVRIYREVSTTPVRHRIDRERLLSSFLAADNFSLLKWQAYDT